MCIIFHSNIEKQEPAVQLKMEEVFWMADWLSSNYGINVNPCDLIFIRVKKNVKNCLTSNDAINLQTIYEIFFIYQWVDVQDM